MIESPLIIGGVLGIIIIIGVGAIQKSIKTDDKGKAKDIIYMSAIFSMLLVVAISFAMYSNDVAFDYLSFAGTVTSIVLSVIAIIMTISSERKSDNVKAQLDITIQAMKQMNEELTNKIKEMKFYGDSVEENTTQVLQKMNVLVDKVSENIAGTIEGELVAAKTQKESKEPTIKEETVSNMGTASIIKSLEKLIKADSLLPARMEEDKE